MADVRTPLLTAALLLAGCLGDVPTGGNTGGGGADAGGGDAAAATAWTTNIAPIVTRCTTGTSCHAAPSVQNPRLTSFADFKANGVPAGKYLKKPSSSNIMITKATMLGTGITTHQGVQYLSSTESMTFATFIDTYGM